MEKVMVRRCPLRSESMMINGDETVERAIHPQIFSIPTSNYLPTKYLLLGVLCVRICFDHQALRGPKQRGQEMAPTRKLSGIP